MLNKLDKQSRSHLQKIKEMNCGVCDAPGPSEAHHIVQHLQYLCVPLCPECHRGSILGWHGQKRAWLIRKVDEMDVLNETVRKLVE